VRGGAPVAASWVYKGVWGVLVRALRVPDEPPTLPVRDGDTSMQFQPAPGFLEYMKFWFWVAFIVIDLAIAGVWVVIVTNNTSAGLALLPVAVFLAFAPDIVAYIAIHVRYDTTWYVMTGRSLRIRRGVWRIHETTVTFENVQNVRVTQGPLQRAFGIANVIVETAGSGAGEGAAAAQTVKNMAVIEGVNDAAAIREQIMSRVRASRSAGLGDEASDSGAGAPAWTPAHLEVLRAIRDEARALRLR